jgi:CcmD family protein
MKVLCKHLAVVVLAVLCAGAVPMSAARTQTGEQSTGGQTKEQQTQYVPISELPPQEQLPAARLLVAAYSFVIVVLFLYVVSVARRLTTVQREVERLEADVKRTCRA